ncbi:AAA family ATPase [Rathayibacter sp. AY1A3]|uniref:AAA family ATPase n=1 Tax=Rathayibacter sp. AY1A3 TaxID=2080521 RepID=UPI0015E44142|nr:AAA family ATPase [Rathayibacter sp. AY1A3]
MTEAPRNPYRPGVGLRPTFLAGRQPDIDGFIKTLASSPEIPGNCRITGLRGVGKTVLLQRFQEEAEAGGWATINVELEPRHCSDDNFRQLLEGKAAALEQDLSVAGRVRNAAGAIAGVARRAATVEYEGFKWSLAGDLDSTTKSIATILLEAATNATKQDRLGLVVLFDEAQVLVDDRSPAGDHPLSSLIASVSTLQKQGVPLNLVLCGLPTLAVNLLSARTYTERMFRGFKISSLKTEDAKAAFLQPLENTSVSATPDVTNQVVFDVDGYPYFIQLWGAELWDATVAAGVSVISLETLRLIEDRITQRLDLDFYEPRIESLTPAEQDLLMDSAKCTYPPLVVKELNKESKKSNENINVLLGRLVKSNILYRPRKGEYRYTAPKFRDFLLRRFEAVDEDY